MLTGMASHLLQLLLSLLVAAQHGGHGSSVLRQLLLHLQVLPIIKHNWVNAQKRASGTTGDSFGAGTKTLNAKMMRICHEREQN
jgi:hypothetical protein